MTRSVAAVLAGYLVFGVSAVLLFQVSGVAPEAPPSLRFAVFSTLYGIGFAFGGGFLAASLSGRAETWHGAAVGVIIAVLAAVSMLIQSGSGSLWSQVATLVLMAPAAAAGGYARHRTRDSSSV